MVALLLQNTVVVLLSVQVVVVMMAVLITILLPRYVLQKALFWVPIILGPKVTKSKIKNQKLICSSGDLYCKICANTKRTQARID